METVKKGWYNLLDYTNIRKKPDLSVCDGTLPISREFLSTIFHKPITKDNYKKYRKLFLKECGDLLNAFQTSKTITELSEKLYTFIPYEASYPQKKSVELFTNLIAFGLSTQISWSDYLLYYPSGKEMIYNIFRKPTQCMAIINLLMILTKVYALNQYDDMLFRKEFLSFLPDINHVLKGTMLEDSLIRWGTSMMTTTALITAIKYYLDTTTECKAGSRTPELLSKSKSPKNSKSTKNSKNSKSPKRTK